MATQLGLEATGYVLQVGKVAPHPSVLSHRILQPGPSTLSDPRIGWQIVSPGGWTGPMNEGGRPHGAFGTPAGNLPIAHSFRI